MFQIVKTTKASKLIKDYQKVYLELSRTSTMKLFFVIILHRRTSTGFLIRLLVLTESLMCELCSILN